MWSGGLFIEIVILIPVTVDPALVLVPGNVLRPTHDNRVSGQEKLLESPNSGEPDLREIVMWQPSV